MPPPSIEFSFFFFFFFWGGGGRGRGHIELALFGGTYVCTYVRMFGFVSGAYLCPALKDFHITWQM